MRRSRFSAQLINRARAAGFQVKYDLEAELHYIHASVSKGGLEDKVFFEVKEDEHSARRVAFLYSVAFETRGIKKLGLQIAQAGQYFCGKADTQALLY